MVHLHHTVHKLVGRTSKASDKTPVAQTGVAHIQRLSNFSQIVISMVQGNMSRTPTLH